MSGGEKACLHCKKTKPLSEFRVGRRKTKTGVTVYFRGDCRDCARVIKTEWGRNNRDKVMQSNLKHRDTILTNRKERYKEVRERLRAECRAYYSTHKQEALDRNRKNREELAYSYVRTLVPQELVEAKRLQLLIKRSLKNEKHN